MDLYRLANGNFRRVRICPLDEDGYREPRMRHGPRQVILSVLSMPPICETTGAAIPACRGRHCTVRSPKTRQGTAGASQILRNNNAALPSGVVLIRTHEVENLTPST